MICQNQRLKLWKCILKKYKKKRQKGRWKNYKLRKNLEDKKA